MKQRIAVIGLIIVAISAILTALAHMSCIYLGTECYAVQMAPKAIIDSSIEGGLLAPIGTTMVSGLFVLSGLYALSAAKIIKPLPLLRPAAYTISALCLLRGGILIPAYFLKPEVITFVTSVASGVWFLCGVLFLFGFRTITAQRV